MAGNLTNQQNADKQLDKQLRNLVTNQQNADKQLRNLVEEFLRAGVLSHNNITAARIAGNKKARNTSLLLSKDEELQKVLKQSLADGTLNEENIKEILGNNYIPRAAAAAPVYAAQAATDSRRAFSMLGLNDKTRRRIAQLLEQRTRYKQFIQQINVLLPRMKESNKPKAISHLKELQETLARVESELQSIIPRGGRRTYRKKRSNRKTRRR